MTASPFDDIRKLAADAPAAPTPAPGKCPECGHPIEAAKKSEPELRLVESISG